MTTHQTCPIQNECPTHSRFTHDLCSELYFMCREYQHSQLPEVKSVIGKVSRRSVKPYGEKALISSERDCGVIDHNFEPPADRLFQKLNEDDKEYLR